MKFMIAFGAIVAVTSAASIDIQGAKAILSGPSATMAVDTGSITKTDWNKDIVEAPVFKFGVDVPRVLSVETPTLLKMGVEPKIVKIDDKILLKSGIESPILVKSGLESNILWRSGIETPTVLKTGVDVSTLLKMGVDIPTLLKMGVDVPTLLKMGVESPSVKVVNNWDWDTQLTRSVMPSFFDLDSKVIVI